MEATWLRESASISEVYPNLTTAMHFRNGFTEIIGLFDLFNLLPPGKFFMLFCHLLIFFKINFFEEFFQEYHQCQTVWIQTRPDLGPNCLQRLSADNTRRQRVKLSEYITHYKASRYM